MGREENMHEPPHSAVRALMDARATALPRLQIRLAEAGAGACKEHSGSASSKEDDAFVDNFVFHNADPRALTLRAAMRKKRKKKKAER